MAKFELTDKEQEAAKEWWEKHKLAHHKGKTPYAGVSGYGTQYSVVFDSVFGMIVHVECSRCSHSKDKKFDEYAGCLTDIDNW